MSEMSDLCYLRKLRVYSLNKGVQKISGNVLATSSADLFVNDVINIMCQHVHTKRLDEIF